MFAWIAENAVTIAVIAALLAAVGIAVFILVKDKKKKGSSGVCTGNCATCGMNCSDGNKQK